MLPTSPNAQMFTAFYAFVGVLVVGGAIGVVFGYLVHANEMRKKNRARTALESTHIARGATGEVIMVERGKARSRRQMRREGGKATCCDGVLRWVTKRTRGIRGTLGIDKTKGASKFIIFGMLTPVFAMIAGGMVLGLCKCRTAPWWC